MGVTNRADRIHAKIVFYGPAGAGLTSNLEYIHRKLRRELRGELTVSNVRDGSYELLPVELGSIRDVQTSVLIHTVPTGEGHRGLRREILDGADGVVFVADLRPMRHDATVASLTELREHLATYNRSIDDVLLVVQYNRRDLADENSLDSLHRRLALRPAATFEAVANEGTGVLQTLTCLTKLILNRLRRELHAERAEAAPPQRMPAPSPPVQRQPDPPAPPEEPQPLPAAPSTPAPRAPTPEPTVTAEDSGSFSGPLVAEPASLAIDPEKGFRLASAGPVEAEGDELSIPIRLCEEGSGREISLSLRLIVDDS